MLKKLSENISTINKTLAVPSKYVRQEVNVQKTVISLLRSCSSHENAGYNHRPTIKTANRLFKNVVTLTY